MRKLLLIVYLIAPFLSEVHGQAFNIDFEQTPPGTYTNVAAISGWTLTSLTQSLPINSWPTCSYTAGWVAGSPEFSILSTPVTPPNFSLTGLIGTSPLGGNNIAQLNNATPNSIVTRLSRTYFVNSKNTTLDFAFAGYWEEGGPNHYPCCEEAGFQIIIKDTTGTILGCNALVVLPGPGCASSGVTFSTNTSASWSNWQVRTLDLSAYFNSTIVIEIMSKDCREGGHFGYTYVDCVLHTNPQPVEFCPGSSYAKIAAPFGYLNYQWYNSYGPISYLAGGNSPTLIILSPTVGTNYTLVANPNGPCTNTLLYTIVNSSVSISTIHILPSCASGSVGSATVQTTGSYSGYTYSWVNSTNSVISTNSFVNGLAPGIYSVVASSLGTLNCGNSSSTFVIPAWSTQPLISLAKPYCNGEGYFSFPSGANYQWYTLLGPVTASLGGTSSSFTATNVSAGDEIFVTYLNQQGCRDSIRYVMTPAPSGTLSVISNPTVCMTSTNAVVVLSLSPSAGTMPSSNYFFAQSSSTSISNYTSSQGPGNSPTFSATGLSANTSYSVLAFDGFCKYNSTFSVATDNFDYTIFPFGPTTICPQKSLRVKLINFVSSHPASGFSAAIVPTTNISGYVSDFTINAPPTQPNSQTSVVYTLNLTYTPTACTLTKTLSIAFYNPPTPTLGAIPLLCSGNAPYTVVGNPANGLFFGPQISPTGVITPAISNIGASYFTYSVMVNNCGATASGNFTVNISPTVSVRGETKICAGKSVSLAASGAQSYTWSNGATTFWMIDAPLTNKIYTVAVTNPPNLCIKEHTISVLVGTPPTVSIEGNNTICSGDSALLFASGASLYNWGPSFGSSVSLTPEVTTSYTLTSTDSLGICPSHDVFTIFVTTCTGIEETDPNNQALPHPNPGNGLYNLSANEPIELRLYDALGRELLSEKSIQGSYELDLRTFANGTYLLRIDKATGSYLKKIVKVE